MSNQPIMCFLGPTAVGKTALVREIARRVPITLISVDASQVYRGFDRGTAKPSLEDQSTFPHALIDVCEPDQSFSAADFVRLADQAIAQALKQGRMPLLCGGTLFYFHIFFQALPQLPAAHPALRQALSDDVQRRGTMPLYRALKKMDAEAAARINLNDKQRLIRALEIILLTGKKIPQRSLHPNYQPIYYLLQPPSREALRHNIQQRLDSMLAAGFITEVESLLRKWPYCASSPAWKAIGYAQVTQYLQGKLDRETMKQQIITLSAQFAKKQLTWMRQFQGTSLTMVNPSQQLEQVLQLMIQHGFGHDTSSARAYFQPSSSESAAHLCLS